MQLVDTHCHIHEAAGSGEVANKWHKGGKQDPSEIYETALAHDVTQMICVGCTLPDSQLAVQFVQEHKSAWASIGLHPHEAKEYANFPDKLKNFAELADKPKVVAVGECGLDYYYNHSSKEEQEQVLRFQIELALEHNLPMIFHVREAFDDFWKIFDSYNDVRGAIHSFSATEKELSQIIERGLYVGLNGIMTFTKNDVQLAAAKTVPLNRLVLETDAPFLTPAPKRDETCEPKHVRTTAEFLANLRSESLEDLAAATTHNANELFNFK